jgi:hypothetical protein
MRIKTVKADLEAFAKAIDVDLGIATEKISRDLHERIVERTPVDTGRAKASWDVAVGAPGGSVPPEGKESYSPAGFGAPLIDGTAPVFIVSNIPYIEALENGHSKQAPQGMIALSVAETVAEIEGLLAGMTK